MQVTKVAETLKPLLPIKFQRVVIRITIPPQHSGKTYPVLKRTIGKFDEQWLNDGSLQVTIEIPAGIQQEVYDRLNNLTHGQVEVKIVKRVGD